MSPNAAFQCVDGRDGLRLYLNWGLYDVSAPEPSVPLSAFDEKLDDFKSVFLKFRDAMAAAAEV